MSSTVADAPRVTIPESPSLDSLTLEKTKAVTVRIPKTILDRIDTFQDTFRARFGRVLSKEKAVLRLLLLAEFAGNEQTRRWDEELEAAAQAQEEE